jgi:putative tricarboxylic transport membrane protein
VNKLINVENVAGAQGEKARRYVAVQNKGNPHMLFAFSPAVVNTPLLLGSEITAKSFTPIAVLALDVSALVVHAESPYKSLADLITAAKQNPKKIVYGGGPYGSSGSMAGSMLAAHAGVQFSYTPFKGGGEAVLRLLGKHIDFMMANPGEITQHVKAGTLRVLAVSEPTEIASSAPTFAKAGYDFKPMAQFRGVVAPPAIGTDVQEFYIKTLGRMRETPEWQQYLKNDSLNDAWITGAELGAFIDQAEKTYLKVSKEMGLLKKK